MDRILNHISAILDQLAGSVLGTLRRSPVTAAAAKAKVNANWYAVVERGEGNLSFDKLQRILKVLGITSLDVS